MVVRDVVVVTGVLVVVGSVEEVDTELVMLVSVDD